MDSPPGRSAFTIRAFWSGLLRVGMMGVPEGDIVHRTVDLQQRLFNRKET